MNEYKFCPVCKEKGTLNEMYFDFDVKDSECWKCDECGYIDAINKIDESKA